MLKSMHDQMGRDLEVTRERDSDMRIYEKQAHRERRTDMGNIFFDAIFEIANEAYILQQKSDATELDSRNWREWLQLFIEDMPVSKTLSDLIEQTELPETQEQANAKLDQRELNDYLEN